MRSVVLVVSLLLCPVVIAGAGTQDPPLTKMVRIPAGEFDMAGPGGDEGLVLGLELQRRARSQPVALVRFQRGVPLREKRVGVRGFDNRGLNAWTNFRFSSPPEDLAMMIDSSYQPERNVRLHTVSGPVSIPEIMAELGRVHGSDEFPRLANVIWDFSNADVSSVTRDQVLHLVAFVRRTLEGDTGYKVAFIAGSDLTFGMTRMYEQLQNAFSEDSIRVFRSAEDAGSWVRGNDE